VDLLLELAIEVSHLDIHLMYDEVLLDGDGEDGAEGQELDNWGESLIVIEAFDLSKALGNNACFVLLYLAIWSTFDAKNPLTAYNFVPFRPWDYVVNPHLLEVLDFVFTGCIPLSGITAHHGLLVCSRVIGLVCENDVGLLHRTRSVVG